MKYFLFLFLFIIATHASTLQAADFECVDPSILAPRQVRTEKIIFTGTSLKTEELASGMNTHALETVRVDSVAQGEITDTITIKYTAHQSLGFGCSGGPGAPSSSNIYIVERTSTGTYIGTQRLLPTDYAAKTLKEALMMRTSTLTDPSPSNESIVSPASSTTPAVAASTTATTSSPETLSTPSESPERIGLMSRLVDLLKQLVSLLLR